MYNLIVKCLYQWKSLTRYQIKVMKFYFLLILNDNLHDFAYNRWQHGTCIMQGSVKIQILHVPKRGAFYVQYLIYLLWLNFLRCRILQKKSTLQNNPVIRYMIPHNLNFQSLFSYLEYTYTESHTCMHNFTWKFFF